jgi:MFS transporter, BCD family, chlorophyll transporter
MGLPKLSRAWMKISPDLLPFADAASETLPLGRLFRLSLFQVSVGMVAVLLIGTLNRVMIVELGVPTWMVAVMVSLPLVFAPFRALIGFRSDQYKSVLGWKRVPYVWLGSVWIFGGLAMMPFALIVLSGDTFAPPIVGQLAAGIAFLCVGAGMHTVQTVGLALATDLSPVEQQPRVVALLSVMLLLGMLLSALIFGALLADFSQLRLIQVIRAPPWSASSSTSSQSGNRRCGTPPPPARTASARPSSRPGTNCAAPTNGSAG